MPSARLRAILLAAIASLALALLPGAGRAATTSSDFFVTIVARQCPEYTDVMANRARNNIMESLRDLGKDSVYRSGQPVSFDVEDAEDPACTPLVGWTFTFGSGIGGKVSGDFGRLSVVSGAQSTRIVTRKDVPRRDENANPVGGGAKVEGAVTIGLNREQADLAQRRSLWIQGGTPPDPINDGDFPGEYGFAALRCAIDNLNGDNVEWIAFPTGTRHVICYAYYVKPPPTSGTIVVQKAVQAEGQPSVTFGFGGNVSYNPGGLFSLDVVNGRTASQTFVRAETRAGDDPWVVEERPTEGWRLTELACTTRRGSDVDTRGGRASIRLVANDTVTCRYTNAPVVTRTLTVAKVSLGGTGRFPITVTPPEGDPVRATLATTAPGRPEVFDTGLSGAGVYTIDEDLPEASGGRWSLARVECDGVDLPATLPVRVAADGEDAPACTLVNRFVPTGSLAIDAVTRGGLAEITYVISTSPPPVQGFQQARTLREDVPARAQGTSTDPLPLRTYTVRQLQPVSDGQDSWALVQVSCNGRELSPDDGRVVVTITDEDPDVVCRFTNVRRTPPPPPPPGRRVFVPFVGR